MSKYRLILKNGIVRVIETDSSNAVQVVTEFMSTCHNGYVIADDNLVVPANEILLFEKIKE